MTEVLTRTFLPNWLHQQVITGRNPRQPAKLMRYFDWLLDWFCVRMTNWHGCLATTVLLEPAVIACLVHFHGPKVVSELMS